MMHIKTEVKSTITRIHKYKNIYNIYRMKIYIYIGYINEEEGKRYTSIDYAIEEKKECD